MATPIRCPGTAMIQSTSPTTIRGLASHDDAQLFEILLLEGQQAGLSWTTALKRREDFRAAFDGFDPERLACYTPVRIAN